ncbi:crossover junction endodeoxyribonuclease RuvC [Mechercharimyces sp. CAU 1602]|uniref:crossover junction endodeoxyribonuclease RuvC n=1 Tax=Mechercharimyces sp. CAU 1602 TaxID=2973933 RepID=UPI0021610FD6|nr:crossover junction endodeoxyribonuclease RuvC [Mechercharimyces sp. CAU 1602]MCS1350361.1 crossover junction endodeoxyribonuclease RuvC [Mechercharimyces sp. CAU 1602]
MKNRYFGLDLSISCPGFAVLEVKKNRKPTLLFYGHLKTNPKLPHGDRLAHIKSYVEAIRYDYGPFVKVIREKAFHNARVHATAGGYKVAGIVDYALRGVEIEELANSTVKKEVTGNGRASKDDVEVAVRGWFPEEEFKTDDESDAVAVVLACLLREGLIEEVK